MGPPVGGLEDGSFFKGKIGLIALKENEFRKIPLKDIGPVKYHRTCAASSENSIPSRKPSVYLTAHLTPSAPGLHPLVPSCALPAPPLPRSELWRSPARSRRSSASSARTPRSSPCLRSPSSPAAAPSGVRRGMGYREQQRWAESGSA